MYFNFSKQYNEWASCYDPMQKEIKKLRQFIDLKDKRVLDIGCGTGRLTFRLAKYAENIIGIDNDYFAITLARALNEFKNTSFEHCDAIKLPIFPHKFDVIFFSWSLNYMADACAAIKEAVVQLSEHGQIVIMYTAKGDYENLMQDSSDNETILCENYDVATRELQKNNFTLRHDEIDSEFVFSSVDDAVDKNEFFFKVDKNVKNYDVCVKNFRVALQNRAAIDGSISIDDKVKLLIARR